MTNLTRAQGQKTRAGRALVLERVPDMQAAGKGRAVEVQLGETFSRTLIRLPGDKHGGGGCRGRSTAASSTSPLATICAAKRRKQRPESPLREPCEEASAEDYRRLEGCSLDFVLLSMPRSGRRRDNLVSDEPGRLRARPAMTVSPTTLRAATPQGDRPASTAAGAAELECGRKSPSR